MPAEIRLALCGDVMLGRGVDQSLRYPGSPRLTGKANNAKVYVLMAEHVNGALPRDRDAGYVWGDALAEFDSFAPDLKLINLETAITAQGRPWPKKTIHFRMGPRNIEVLTAAGIDFCALANNHVMDWGYLGLGETIQALRRAGIACAGAGRDRAEAAAPAILPIPGKGRVIVVSLGTPSGHILPQWGAGDRRPGINLVRPTHRGLDGVKRAVAGFKQPGDLLIASIHSGSNYGHAINPDERALALRLIDEAGFDLIHCHSAHHVKAIEMHNGRPILYGTGDLINDYEGLRKTKPKASFRPDLGTIVLARFAADTGACIGLELRPTQVRGLRVARAGTEDKAALCAILNRESAPFGTRIVDRDGLLALDIARDQKTAGPCA